MLGICPMCGEVFTELGQFIRVHDDGFLADDEEITVVYFYIHGDWSACSSRAILPIVGLQ